MPKTMPVSKTIGHLQFNFFPVAGTGSFVYLDGWLNKETSKS
jgi:hypothetical protein